MDKEEKDFLKKSFCARVVMKNACGKLEGRWKILFKLTECRLFNVISIG